MASAKKQTEVHLCPSVLPTKTLPHTEEDGGEYRLSVLTKLTATTLDARSALPLRSSKNDNTIKERTFENVPVTRNQITRYTGSFFGSCSSGQQSDGTFRLTADPDWDNVNGYTF